MMILNMSEKNTGIWRYISNIGAPIITSLAINRGNFDGGIVFEKRVKYIPFSMSLKYAGFIFKNTFGESLKEFLEHYNSGIIYASQGVPVTVNRTDNFAIIHDILTLKYHKSKRYKKYLRNNLEKMKEFMGIVTVSKHTKSDLKDLGFDENKIDVIYPYISNNIQPINKSKEEIRKELNLPLNKKVIINVAGNTPNKANDELPIIAKLSDDYLLIHVGNEIRGKNILNFENVNDEFLSKLYQASDIYLSTSLDEGFGIPPIEAQKFGLPVVARKLGVFDETMGDSYVNLAEFTWIEEDDLENGDIDFKVNNANAYWQGWRYAIEYALEHSEEYRGKAIENAKKYTEEVFKENWKKQIKKWEGMI